MGINPTALIFWMFCSGVGYLIGGDVHSAVIGAVVGFGISLLAEIFL